MNIFILRDGEQTGPFNEQAVQDMISRGATRLKDLAWRKGLPAWLPLGEVLNPGSQKPSDPPPAVQLSGVRMASESAGLPTAKQKALLTYLGVELSSSASKADAALLVSDALENPKFQARLAKWSEEKLRINPEAFADEIQHRKAGRAAYYMELCQTEGDGVVKEVTKAHCQVLVESLDKRFPAWESDPKVALWHYFLPSIAEHFPMLLQPEWKSKLRMGSVPKSAPTKAAAATSGALLVAPAKDAGPMRAALRGVAYGLATLAIAIGGIQLFKPAKPEPAPPPVTNTVTPPQIPPPEPPATIPPVEQPPLIAAIDPAPAAQPEAPVFPIPNDPAPAPNPPPAEPAAPPMKEEPAPAPPLPAFNPVPPGPPSLPRADAPAVAAPAIPANPATMPAAPVAVAPKSVLTLTKPVTIQLQYGKVTLPPGTKVRYIGVDARGLRCNFNNDIIIIPAASTDFDGTAPTAALTQPPSAFPAQKPVVPSDL
jgi:hypothetical protein